MNKFARFFRRPAALPAAGLLLVSGLVLSLPRSGHAQLAVQDLVSIPRRGTELMKIDRDTGETISSLTINLPDDVICNFSGGSGLATDPLTEELFALLNCGSGMRLLAIIDTFDGNATVIGDTGHNFAALAFAGDGTLFAVTGNGAAMPNTLFTLSTADATASPVCGLPDQPPLAGGQAMAFNPDDGLLYHASGNEEQGGTKIFESINDVTPTEPLAPCLVTPRGPTGADYIEATAMVFSGSSFFLGDLDDGSTGNLYRITDEGVVTLVGAMDHVSKGLAFISGPAEVCYKVKKDAASGANQTVVVEDAIAGSRAALIKSKKAFTLCVPGNIRFKALTTITPHGPAPIDEEIVQGKVCYRVKKDDSGAANKTDVEVEDESNGERTLQIKTKKAFVICDHALIDRNALP